MATATQNEPLLQMLLDHGVVSAEQIQDIREEQTRSGKPFRDVVLNMEILTEDELLQLVAEGFGTRVINLPATDIPPDVIHSIPASVARMYNVVPVEKGNNSVTLATQDLMSPATLDELQFVLSRDVALVLSLIHI